MICLCNTADGNTIHLVDGAVDGRQRSCSDSSLPPASTLERGSRENTMTADRIPKQISEQRKDSSSSCRECSCSRELQATYEHDIIGHCVNATSPKAKDCLSSTCVKLTSPGMWWQMYTI